MGITVALYSHDSVGLGHARRNRALAWPLAETLPRPTTPAGGPSSSPTRTQPATADPDAPAALPDVVVTDEGTAWRVEWARPGKTDEPDAPLSVEVRAGGALRAGRAEANLDGISRAAAVERDFTAGGGAIDVPSYFD